MDLTLMRSLVAVADTGAIGTAADTLRLSHPALSRRIKQLEELVELSREASHASERGFYLFSLGLALKAQGDDDGARTVLQEAQSLGPDVLGADLFRSVVSALS